MAAKLLPTDPFNHYNTEFVKLDANNPMAEDEGGELRSFSELSLAPADFALLAPDDQLVDGAPLATPPDSINNKSFTDVTFIVGPSQHSKKYVGHRVLLAMTSPVFETMFYGDMADKNKYIRIADVAPIGFENLLRYAYTDSLNLNSVEDAMLTAYAAKKYLLPQLLRECLTYIELNISPASACVVFEFAHVLNSQQLVLQAMNLIDRQTGSVLQAKSFSHVQATTVEFVANRKYLNLNSEFALFEALLSWSLAEAKRRQLPPGDWLAIRTIMSEISILSAIRFLAITPGEFARAVSQSSGRLEANNSRASITATNGDDGSKPADGDTATIDQETEALELDDSNSLLTVKEQRTVLLNLASPNLAQMPNTLSKATRPRQPPPDYFTLRRFRSSGNLTTTTTTTRSIKCISAKFQCLSENVFIVALTIPIKLDAGSYANRTPKFECHLKFTTRTTSNVSPVPNYLDGNDTTAGGTNSMSGAGAGGATTGDGPAVLMDTIDESLHISIARDKDCLVKLKRPILIRMGNINELTLTFQTYALDEDIVTLQTPKLRAANFSEQTDGENISWLFFKTANVEFSELHYYY